MVHDEESAEVFTQTVVMPPQSVHLSPAGAPTSNAGLTPTLVAARIAATRAAVSTGVRVSDEASQAGFLAIESLFTEVWGLQPLNTPIPAELLRSFQHAGCNITVAHNRVGLMVGAAVGIVSPGGQSMYSLIAGVRPGTGDRGVGFALKQHQRVWGLTRGMSTMTWTFDPLVSRNARFNLTKLGAVATEYAPNFYGPMHGDINANDESDRLVALWQLDSDRTAACAAGVPHITELPAYSEANVQEFGPDGHPALIEVGGSLWCRVPNDIVAMRADDAQQATSAAGAWRKFARRVFTAAFSSGHIASGVSRSGWYRLDPRHLDPTGSRPPKT